MSDKNQDIIIVGGGAGGAELAVRLAKAGCANLRLVDLSATHFWKPRLHERAVGARGGELDEIAYPDLAERWGFRFEHSVLTDLDATAQTVTLRDADKDETRTLGFRILVLAVGGVTPDFGVPGVAEHALVLDRTPDADLLHERFSNLLARCQQNSEATRARIAIVGSGLTGIELAGYLASHPRAVIKPGASSSQTLDISLFEADDTFMPAFEDKRIRGGARMRLEKLGVTIRTGVNISQIDGGGLQTEDGTRFAADLTIWAAGRVGSPLAPRIKALAANDKQQWWIRDTLQTRDFDPIFAIGDCAARLDSPWPATAQVAGQQAEHLAEQILNLLDDATSPEPFVFKDQGVLMSFGDGGDLGLIHKPLLGTVRVEDQVAHAAYRALERRHQWILLGTQRTLKGAVGDFYDHVLEPRRQPR